MSLARDAVNAVETAYVGLIESRRVKFTALLHDILGYDGPVNRPDEFMATIDGMIFAMFRIGAMFRTTVQDGPVMWDGIDPVYELRVHTNDGAWIPIASLSDLGKLIIAKRLHFVEG